MPVRTVVGRAAELRVIDEFLDTLISGPSVVVLEGEPGIGKTTVWQEALDRAGKRGIHVLSSRPGSAETRLTFVGLADFLRGVDENVYTELPGPQRRAFDIALLREEPGRTALEQRVVSTAFLGVLRILAADAPVLVAVDDLQWLDTPSRRVLEFVVRRLESERVGVLAALRSDGSAAKAFAEPKGRRIRLQSLNLAALHEILKAELGRTFARPALVRIETVSSGNPFFALELGRAIVERGEPLRGSAPLPVPDDLADLIAGRLRRLPKRVRSALLVASAISRPTLDVLDRDAIARAEEAGVVVTDASGGVRFAHPLLAATVYASASGAHRREAHRELASRVASSEERARHRALAAEGPDDEVARSLAEAARFARDRGAPDAAIELLELACDLTPPSDGDSLYVRRLDLGRYLAEAGDPGRARGVLRDVAQSAPSGGERARALLLLAYGSETAEAGETAIELCEEGLAAAGDDVELRVEILAAASRMADFDAPRKVAYAREALELSSRDGVGRQLRSYALLAFAEAEFFAGRGIAHDAIRRAAELETETAGAEEGRSLHRVHHYADVRPSARLLGILRIYADELDEARAEFELEREVASEHGDEVQLARSLIRLGLIEVRAGNWNLAERHLDEAASVLERTGQEALRRWLLATRATLDALRGRVSEARSAGEEALALSEEAGADWGIAECHAALGFLDLSAGELADAVGHFARAAEVDERMGSEEPRLLRHHADHVETLIALGELEAADGVLRRLERSSSPWAAATGGRSRALVLFARGDLSAALDAIDESLAAHDSLPIPFELARTLLVKGQVHRRRNERRLAREALDRSWAIFEELGAPLWVAKADAERRRLGLRRGTSQELTPSEHAVAAFAASGLTNREIAERMFISPKTVEANLARAYRKLGIRTRAELGARMGEREAKA